VAAGHHRIRLLAEPLNVAVEDTTTSATFEVIVRSVPFPPSDAGAIFLAGATTFALATGAWLRSRRLVDRSSRRGRPSLHNW
jgi:hypothetical protein